MKFEKDFDFESANAQFNKEEIDREFQSKLKLKGSWRSAGGLHGYGSAIMGRQYRPILRWSLYLMLYYNIEIMHR